MNPGPVGFGWDGKVWMPPFGFDPYAQPVTYQMFPREAWRFCDYCINNAFNPVRVDFPHGGGRWYGIRCSMTTIYDPSLVGELSRSWPGPSGMVPPEWWAIPPGEFIFDFPGLLQPRRAASLLEFCFHHGQPFSFLKDRENSRTRVKVLDAPRPSSE